MSAVTSEIGTFRTWRDVRLESVMRTRADVVTVRLGLQNLGGRKQVPGRPNRPGRVNHGTYGVGSPVPFLDHSNGQLN